MKRQILILSTVFLAYTAIQAQSTASAIFLLIAPGATAGGTGEAQVAAATDAYASYWNPAALAFLPRGEVVYQRAAWLPNLPISGSISVCAGLFWNLRWREGRGIGFSFLDEEWPVREPTPFGKILPIALLIGALVAYMVLWFVWDELATLWRG